MNKDAYLILAHKTDYTFNTLLELLDNEKNDIYIHMDKKTKNVNEENIKSKIKKSNVYFVDRVKCNWGGFSLVKAELNLLKEATKKNYRYYHLLSGQDLPIKSQEEIYEFFEKNNGKQFISFQEKEFKFEKRIKYYYPFQEILGRIAFKTLRGKIISKPIMKIQDILKIYRNKNIKFQKGDQWFSITDEFAKHVVSNEKKYTKIFKSTYCPDELFIQTIFINSKYIKSLYSHEYNNPSISTKRFIDWNRGTPYVWKSEDFNELIESKSMFARKFDEKTDKEIINKIKLHLSK